MSTRGCLGFRLNEEDKLTYNHSDSYPSWLGVQVLDFLHQRSQTPDWINTLKKSVNDIVMISECIECPVEVFLKARELGFYEGSGIETVYDVLRDLHGDLGAYLILGYMPDARDFVKDSLFCEYAYIVNLDDQKLEFYKGYNRNPCEAGRYAMDSVGGQEHYDPDFYYGVVLERSYDLNDLPTKQEFLNDVGRP